MNSINRHIKVVLIIVLTILVNACDKTQQKSSEPNFIINSGDVLKVTPKQALIDFSVMIPDEIGFGDCQVGIAYSSSPSLNPYLIPLVPFEELSSNSMSATIKLVHLDCGARYYYATYVKYMTKSFLATQSLFAQRICQKMLLILA